MTALGSLLLGVLAACDPGMQAGFSGREREWDRTRSSGPFAVVSTHSRRAVISADGNRIAVEPSAGFCLAEDSIETSDRSAFLLIGDCVLDGTAGMAPAGGDLPAGMPGIITVSISGDPGFSQRGRGKGLAGLEAFLGTPEGRALLGRGGDGSQVAVVDTRRVGDSLYVLVEDRDGSAVPVLAPRFWRAFVELNERLAVVTVSGFRDVPMDEQTMLAHLGDQVRQLQLANAVPVDEAPVRLAQLPVRTRPAETGSGDEPDRPHPGSGDRVGAEPLGTPAGDGNPWLAATVAALETAPTVDSVSRATLQDWPASPQAGAGGSGIAGGWPRPMPRPQHAEGARAPSPLPVTMPPLVTPADSAAMWGAVATPPPKPRR